MNKIFIIWGNYDGNYVEEFVGPKMKEKAEERCVKIMAKKGNYGTQIKSVIQGKELKIITIKVVAKVSLE